MLKNKKKLVQEIFTSVASKYDLMNDLMSLGIHRQWKKQFVEDIPSIPFSSLIDVAGGTGDIAARFLQKNPTSRALICDRNFKMLRTGIDKLINKNLKNTNWVCAEAENLPFIEQLFDCYTISFGIRNVYSISDALNEAYRILKVGGKFMCLEFGHPQNKLLAALYNCYSYKVIPFLGKQIAGDKGAYDYLINSIREFPSKELFLNMIKSAGFKDIKVKDLSGGIVNIYSAWRY